MFWPENMRHGDDFKIDLSLYLKVIGLNLQINETEVLEIKRFKISMLNNCANILSRK